MIKKTKKKINSFLYAASIGLLALAAVLIAGFFALAFSNADKILYGISAAGENLGHLSPQTAEQTLDRKISNWQTEKIKLKYENKIWEAVPEEMGVSIDTRKTIDQAYEIGRNKNILKSATDQIVTAFFGRDVAPKTTIDDERFKDFRARLFGKIAHPVKNAALEYNQNTGLFEVVKEENGYELNENKLRADLADNAARLAARDIVVEMIEDKPRVNESGTFEAQKKANAILSRAPFTLVYYPISSDDHNAPKPQEYKLDKDQLKDMMIFKQKENSLELETNLDETGLENFLIEISPSINQKPDNAILAMKDGKVTEFALPKNGVELALNQNISGIKDEILNGQSSVISLKANVVLPEIRSDTIENLGLISLLAVGESDFKGSISSRIFNINLGAGKLNGLLIKPGEEFSFVKAIGEISQKEGYQAALVIKGNKTLKEFGGGMCQVSTTMFRAAIKSGLKITERFPHSYPVHYYNPQGFDATVYGPHPDLRFVNDTPSNILVQTKVKNTNLFFEFYGTPDGRDVKVTDPIEYDKKPDGSLKAKFTREIYKDGQLIAQETFRSNYQSPNKAPIQKNPLE